MSASNLFGPIVTRRMVARTLAVHVLEWTPDYLGEVSRLARVPDDDVPDDAKWLPDFQAVRYVPSETTVVNLPENKLPALIVGTPGFAEAPRVEQEQGEHSQVWAFGLHAVVSGQDEDSTDRLVGEYAAALRTLLLQQSKISDHVSVAAQRDEGYDGLPVAASRTLGAGTVTVLVVVENALHELKGPLTPSEDPQADPGPLATVDGDALELTVTRLALED